MTWSETILERYPVPARTGKAFTVVKGDLIRITDVEGQQPVDFWAFQRDDPLEFLSVEHTRPSTLKLVPGVGDPAYTTHRRAIVTVIADNSPGQHDMHFAACDRYRYRELGFEGEHASCTDNLHKALARLGIPLDFTPQPWNLFTNFHLKEDGAFEVRARWGLSRCFWPAWPE